MSQQSAAELRADFARRREEVEGKRARAHAEAEKATRRADREADLGIEKLAAAEEEEIEARHVAELSAYTAEIGAIVPRVFAEGATVPLMHEMIAIRTAAGPRYEEATGCAFPPRLTERAVLDAMIQSDPLVLGSHARDDHQGLTNMGASLDKALLARNALAAAVELAQFICIASAHTNRNKAPNPNDPKLWEIKVRGGSSQAIERKIQEHYREEEAGRNAEASRYHEALRKARKGEPYDRKFDGVHGFLAALKMRFTSKIGDSTRVDEPIDAPAAP